MKKNAIFNGKTIENHDLFMGKRWKIIILNGKQWKSIIFNGTTMKKAQFLMKKRLKITMFKGKTMENHHF
jgi:hypothetical protein